MVRFEMWNGKRGLGWKPVLQTMKLRTVCRFKLPPFYTDWLKPVDLLCLGYYNYGMGIKSDTKL